jgi:hypothetical protein
VKYRDKIKIYFFALMSLEASQSKPLIGFIGEIISFLSRGACDFI